MFENKSFIHDDLCVFCWSDFELLGEFESILYAMLK